MIHRPKSESHHGPLIHMSDNIIHYQIQILVFLSLLGTCGLAVAEAGASSGSSENQNPDVFNPVEIRTTILHIKPPGSPVKKGELVRLLDPSGLQNRLANQSLIVLGARAACENARLDREEAEAAVTDYVETGYPREFETLKGEIARAREALDRAQLQAGRFALDQKIFALEQALTRLKVFEKYTRNKMIKEFQSEVEKAKSAELAMQQTLDVEQGKEARLRRQVEDCKIVSPVEGRLSYPQTIKPGSIVRMGDLLFRVITGDELKEETR